MIGQRFEPQSWLYILCVSMTDVVAAPLMFIMSYLFVIGLTFVSS